MGFPSTARTHFHSTHDHPKKSLACPSYTDLKLIQVHILDSNHLAIPHLSIRNAVSSWMVTKSSNSTKKKKVTTLLNIHLFVVEYLKETTSFSYKVVYVDRLKSSKNTFIFLSCGLLKVFSPILKRIHILAPRNWPNLFNNTPQLAKKIIWFFFVYNLRQCSSCFLYT